MPEPEEPEEKPEPVVVDPPKKKGRLKRIFFTGMVVILPLVITVLIFRFLLDLLNSLLAPTVSTLIDRFGLPVPPDYAMPGLGLLATIIIIFSVGIITTNYVGRKLIGLGEKIVTTIPVIRTVYSGAKQIIDTFSQSTGGTRAFSKVVMFEYPRRGIYSLAFITGETKGEVQLKTKSNLINVFLPTTPNPTSGFLLMVPKEDIIELDMTVEEGIKMIVSGGIVTPDYLPEKKSSDRN